LQQFGSFTVKNELQAIVSIAFLVAFAIHLTTIYFLHL